MVGEPIEVSGDDSVIVRLHVQPGAGRTAVTGYHGDALKVKVGAPPQGGRANEACLALLARILGVKDAQLELTSGASSRTKRVKVRGIEPDDVRRRIAAAVTEANQSGREQGGGRGRSPSRQ